METEKADVRPLRPGAIAAGVILLALGAAMLLDTSGALNLRAGRLLPPFALILMGAAILLDRGWAIGDRDSADDGRVMRRRQRYGRSNRGLWLIGIGAWMLLSQMHLLGFTYGNSWPLFVIFVGLMMVIRGMR